jgi:hypothetical protein
MHYALNIGDSAIGAGIVFRVNIFIAPDAFDFIHPYDAAVSIFILFHQQDLVFIEAFHQLNRMATEQKLGMMGICLLRDKQIHKRRNHMGLPPGSEEFVSEE